MDFTTQDENKIVGTLSISGSVTGDLGVVYGKDGKSAYEVAVDNGFEGTEQEWLDSLGSAALTEGAVQTEHLADDSVTIDKVAFIEGGVSKNLFNHNDVVDGYTLNAKAGNGTTNSGVMAKSGISTSAYIPIDTANKYCLSVFGTHTAQYLRYSFFTSLTDAPTGENEYYTSSSAPWNTGSVGGERCVFVTFGTDGTTDFAIPSDAKYFRFSTYTPELSGFKLQFEEGDATTAYEEYGETPVRFTGVDVLNSDDYADLQTQIEESGANVASSGDLTVTLDGDALTVASALGKRQEITIGATLKDSGYNNQFNLHSVAISKDGAEQYNERPTDDIAPLRTNYKTIGANHSYEIPRVTSSSLNATFIGKTCTNTTDATEYVMVDYTTGGVFVPRCTQGTNYASYARSTIAVGDILSFSNGTEITVEAVANVRYKTVSGVKNYVLADGRKIESATAQKCNTLQVMETYNIISLNGIWDYYANGNTGAYNDVLEELPVCIEMKHTYTFTKGCLLTINTTVRAIEYTYLGNCGMIQHAFLGKSKVNGETQTDDTVYMYINGAGEVDGVNFGGLVDMTGYNQTVFLKPENSAVCNRDVMRCVTADGGLVCGFTTGYIPDLSQSKDSLREGITQYWEVRSNGKVYPVAVYGKNLAAGETANFLAYRAFLPEETPVTNFNIVDVGDTAYLFIDAHESGTYTVDVDTKYCNRAIEVLEQSKISIDSDVVGNSITFKVSDFTLPSDYAHATLKLKSGGLTEAEKQEIVDRVLDALNGGADLPSENPNE